MKNRSKGRSRPRPDANTIKHIIFDLKAALKIEHKYMATVCLDTDQNPSEDSLMLRDTVARKLRFLKTWFDLPSEAFITCINLLDRFLTKLKVREAFLDCLSISCFYVASQLHKCQVCAAELVAISEAKCKVSDLERMCGIVKTKLSIVDGEVPVTAITYLDYYLQILKWASAQLKGKAQFDNMLQRKNLLTRLEVVMLDFRCAKLRPSAVALALVQNEINCSLAALPPKNKTSSYFSPEMYHYLKYISDLQIIAMIIRNQLVSCVNLVKSILDSYDNNSRSPNKGRFKRRYSLRMNKHLKPSENFCTRLCVIRE